jgi:hypothetical protein
MGGAKGVLTKAIGMAKAQGCYKRSSKRRTKTRRNKKNRIKRSK